MADPALLQNILSGILSGGTSAATAFAAVFRDIKKRLKALEERIGADGADGDPKTGLFLLVERADELSRKLKKELEQWEEDPPEWLVRLINRSARNSSMNLESHNELERLVEQRFRTNAQNISRVEDRLEKDFIDRAEYDKDVRERSQELSSLREQLAAANGLLRGAMAALGYSDPTPQNLGPPPKKRF